jgi:hypothetical protein
MFRKLSLALLLFINFAVLPQSFGEEKVIIDRISEKEAEDLNIEIPEDVPPGFHIVTIEVYDDNGTVSEKTIEFCKDENGDVQWDNNCPNLKLDDEETKEDLELPVTVDDTLKPYDPMQDSETTKGIQIAAFAILSVLTATKRNDDREKSEEDEGQESLQSVSAGALRLLKDEPGWGDNSRTWQNPLTTRSDALFLRLANFLNGRSPLLTRTAIDGNTIRAIIGGWALLFLPIGALLGTVAISSVGFESLPPVWSLVAVIMAISIFDAFAGFLAGSIFFLGALLTGHITNRPEFLTAIGVLVLFFAPALLASAFRPFRRLVRSNDDRWERITDYALGTLLTYWVITKMVGAMNGLARLDLPISKYGQELGLIAAALLLIRILMEDLAVEHYPMRLRSLHVEIADVTHRQKIQSLVFKIFVFFVMAAPFAGSLVNLLLGTLIFAVPLITSLQLEDSLPKKKLYLPKGVLKTVVMIFVMALVSQWIEGLFTNTATFLKWSFVVMALPGFLLHYLDAITDTPDRSWRTTKNGRMIYRLGGVIVFILMVLVVQGVDIAAWLVD